MKRTLFGLGLAALGLLSWMPKTASAQSEHYKVVLEMTSDQPTVWNHALNHVDNLRQSLGKENVDVEVVCHGEGLNMLKQSHTGPDMQRMQKQAEEHVVFAACENTMKKQHVTKSQLLPFVTTVDSGISEVVRKQVQKWAYLREV